jgi:hypothetical protein
VSAWAKLRPHPTRNGVWQVRGGDLDGLASFFTRATEADLVEYVDPTRVRFIRIPTGCVQIGALATIDGNTVAWLPEKNGGR